MRLKILKESQRLPGKVEKANLKQKLFGKRLLARFLDDKEITDQDTQPYNREGQGTMRYGSGLEAHESTALEKFGNALPKQVHQKFENGRYSAIASEFSKYDYIFDNVYKWYEEECEKRDNRHSRRELLIPFFNKLRDGIKQRTDLGQLKDRIYGAIHKFNEENHLLDVISRYAEIKNLSKDNKKMDAVSKVYEVEDYFQSIGIESKYAKLLIDEILNSQPQNRTQA